MKECKDDKNVMNEISMEPETYERILNNIITKAPLECGVQTLVFMLLDEIISKKYEKKVSLLVADLRKGEKKIFGGNGGVVDLCVVDEKFTYHLAKNEKEKNGECLGCVEVKAAGIELPQNEDIDQIVGHIITYKKVIYTNGIHWQYYEATEKELGEIKETYDKYMKYENTIKEGKKRLRNKLSVNKSRWITRDTIEKIVKELEEEYNNLIRNGQIEKLREKLKNDDLKEKNKQDVNGKNIKKILIKEDEKIKKLIIKNKRNECKDSMKETLKNILENGKSWETKIGLQNGEIVYKADGTGEIKIKDFKDFVDKLATIAWKEESNI